MAKFRLPRLPVNWREQPQLFERYWDEAMRKIDAQENSQDATIDRLRRVLSHTSPTTIMSASPTQVVIADHTRIYGDATTLQVKGATIGGLTPGTTWAFYYDDITLANPTPNIQATTDVAIAQAVSAEGRHFLGVITTPKTGSTVIREGGGAYPVGSSIGGELP